MANLWEMITGLKNKNVQLQPLQFADNGDLDVGRTLELAMQQPRTPMQHLFGREVGVDVDTTNPEDKEATTERVAKFQPGFFNDLRSGANENFVTGFAANNLTDNMANGRKKGFAYRLGEGLGSLARLGESPLGRGLLMAGIVGATGGSGLQALAYGAGTGVGNQQNRMKDKMYRNELNKMGFDTSNIVGYVGDDTFNKIFQSKQLQDNAEYRNALLTSQLRNQELTNRMAQDKLTLERQQKAIDNAFKNRELNIKENELVKDLQQGTQKGETVLNQLQLLENAFSKMPQSTAKVGQKGKAILTGASNLVGLRNNNVTAYEAIRNPLVTTLARSIAGEKGVLTDRDFARAEKMVPTAFDSPEQAQAKFEEIRKLVGVSLGGNVAQMGNTTKSGVKYEVID